MSQIEVRRPSEAEVGELGARAWPIWTQEPSTFPWTYDDAETCLVLEGRVTVTPDGGGAPVEIGPGDLVTFAAGLSCVWAVHEAIRKHYRFG